MHTVTANKHLRPLRLTTSPAIVISPTTPRPQQIKPSATPQWLNVLIPSKEMLQAQSYLCLPTGAHGLGPSLLQCRLAGWKVSSPDITWISSLALFYPGRDLRSKLNLQRLRFELVVGPQHNEGSRTSGSPLFLVCQMIQQVLLEKHGTVESHASATLLWVNVRLPFHIHPWLGSGSWLYISISL